MAKHPPLVDDLTGKVALVTGATGGIGKEIARGLARLGASVVVGGRTPAKASAARQEIEKDAKHPERLGTTVVDVSSLTSIRTCAEALATEQPSLHILVNNAGAWFTDRRESADGHELTFATNVLGPYALTKALLPQLRAAHGARVINVVSEMAANYDANDLEWKTRRFDGFKCYGQSKQALRMVSWIHAAELAGDRITVNAAAPGFVKTDFNQNAKGFVPWMINLFAGMMAVSPAEGADTPIWAAASREVEGQTGKYFDGRQDKDGKFREPGPLAELDAKLAAMLGPA